MELNRKEKDIYRMLWYNPKMSYKEIAEASNSHIDTTVKIVRKIRRLGGFEYSRFDKNYVPEGSMHSIYVEDKRNSIDYEKLVYDIIKNKPNITILEIAKELTISEITARKYYRKANGIEPSKCK